MSPRMLFALGALVACSPKGDGPAFGDTANENEGAEPFLAPDAPGPYTPATREATVTPDHGVPLTVQVWYPSNDPAGTPYLYDGLVGGQSTADLPAACDRVRPVLLFSHGNGGMRWQSIWLTETLAARGWVVVAPDHTFNTVFDMSEAHFAELVFRRPVDIVASYQWLLDDLAAPGGPLDGCVDEAQGYAMAGHSFGGYTSYVVAGSPIDRDATAAECAQNGGWLCAEVAEYFDAHPESSRVDLSDDRVWAAVPMAPAAFETLTGGLAEIAVPVLTWGGTRDSLTPVPSTVRPIYAGIQSRPAYLAVIEDAGHYSFSDACALLDSFPDCAPPYMPPTEVQAIARVNTVAFLDGLRGYTEAEAYLPSDDSALLWESAD